MSEIEQWKLKRLIQMLDGIKGTDTSMITLIIPAGDQISKASQLLIKEQGTATNIKSRVNRLSVLAAIASSQQRLKMYNNTPANGLALFCGIGVFNENEKKISMIIEPFKPICKPVYHCGDKFQTEALAELLRTDDKFGFIIIDGNGTLYGLVCGDNRTVLHKFTVCLPKKHNKGGQSSNRFARLRIEKRHNYLRKVSEMATTSFISDDKVNVKGIILAGSAEFKNDLLKSDLFDPRLQKSVISVVDIAYGDENGFNQAIESSKDILGNVKLIQEKEIIQEFLGNIAEDTGKFIYGAAETMTALEQGIIEKLIVWEDLPINMYKLKNADRPVYAKNSDKITVEIESCEPLLDWIAENYSKFGSSLCLVSDNTAEGSQFVRGFGGIGGILRYKTEIALDTDFDDELDDFI